MTEYKSFEEATEKIDSLIEKLEIGNIPFEESVGIYCEAVEALSYCYDVINVSKGKISEVNEHLESIMKEGVEDD
ncbi:MAG: exodeoxyribonuclease VII small subunit [Ruminococcus sp.]|nr:exodeoxyribonuclease VII small subunit [Ruminococcus sp.]